MDVTCNIDTNTLAHRGLYYNSIHYQTCPYWLGQMHFLYQFLNLTNAVGC